MQRLLKMGSTRCTTPNVCAKTEEKLENNTKPQKSSDSYNLLSKAVSDASKQHKHHKKKTRVPNEDTEMELEHTNTPIKNYKKNGSKRKRSSNFTTTPPKEEPKKSKMVKQKTKEIQNSNNEKAPEKESFIGGTFRKLSHGLSSLVFKGKQKSFAEKLPTDDKNEEKIISTISSNDKANATDKSNLKEDVIATVEHEEQLESSKAPQKVESNYFLRETNPMQTKKQKKG